MLLYLSKITNSLAATRWACATGSRSWKLCVISFSRKDMSSSRVITSMSTDGSVSTIDGINYFTRYSNRMIIVSPLQSIGIAATETK